MVDPLHNLARALTSRDDRVSELSRCLQLGITGKHAVEIHPAIVVRRENLDLPEITLVGVAIRWAPVVDDPAFERIGINHCDSLTPGNVDCPTATRDIEGAVSRSRSFVTARETLGKPVEIRHLSQTPIVQA